MAIDREFMYIGSAGPGLGGRTDGRAEGRMEGGRVDGRADTLNCDSPKWKNKCMLMILLPLEIELLSWAWFRSSSSVSL